VTTTTWVGLGILGFVILFFVLPPIADMLGALVAQKRRSR
jgi:hypothetical protein